MATHTFVVEQIAPLSPTAVSLVLRNTNSAQPFSFHAGQYAALSFNRFDRPTPVRCFSIASSPTDIHRIEFGIRVGGAYTWALLDLRKGDEVSIDGPFGSFVLDEQRDQRVVMLAGGIGITPILSIARFLTRTNDATKATLVYSCQNQDDAPYASELIELARQNPNLRVVIAISRGATDKLLAPFVTSGRITTELLDTLPLTKGNQYKQNSYFICGPTGFMNGMTSLLEKKGVSPERIITEAFGQGVARKDSSGFSFPRQVYALSAIGVLLAAGYIFASDVVNKLSVSQSVAATPSSAVVSDQGTSAVATTPGATTSSTPTTSSTSTRGTTTTTAPTTTVTPTPVSTYQMPMSRTS